MFHHIHCILSNILSNKVVWNWWFRHYRVSWIKTNYLIYLYSNQFHNLHGSTSFQPKIFLFFCFFKSLFQNSTPNSLISVPTLTYWHFCYWLLTYTHTPTHTLCISLTKYFRSFLEKNECSFIFIDFSWFVVDDKKIVIFKFMQKICWSKLDVSIGTVLILLTFLIS